MRSSSGRQQLPAIAALLAVGLGFQPPARGAVLRVALDGSGDFTSVALAARAAASGDSILVDSGRYDDAPVVVPPGVSLSILGTGTAASAVLAKGLYCRGSGEGYLSLATLTIEGGTYDLGLLSVNLLTRVDLRDVTCSGGAMCPVVGACQTVLVESCSFIGNNNTTGTNGGGLSLTSCTEATVRGSLFANNRTIAGDDPDDYGAGGGGLWLDVAAGGSASVSGCTFIGNEAPRGSAATIGGNAVVFQNTIVRNRGGIGALYVAGTGAMVYANVMADNDGYGLLEDGTRHGVECRCNAFWRNRGWPDPLYGHRDQWYGTCGRQPDGSAEEVWDDPQFCGLDQERYGVMSTSPLLPENRDTSVGTCTEVIGAHGAECEPNPPAIAPMSWGRVKARYGAGDVRR